MIEAFIPWTTATEIAVIVGSSKRLGQWSPSEGLKMQNKNAMFFTSDIHIGADEEWKLVIIDKNSITWENGENRTGDPDGVVSFRGGRSATGVEIPLFSLRSAYDNGIGDFGTLELYIKRAARKKHRVIQILPINDTTGANPYEICSAFAINPIYLSLDMMGTLEDAETAHEIADRSNTLSYSPYVEWEEVRDIKWKYFRAIYKQDGEKTCSSRQFSKFTEKNRKWLLPYAAWSTLRNSENIPAYSDELAQSLIENEETSNEIYFHMFLQFHADRQLEYVRQSAHENGILLSAEMPYSVSHDSADVWQYPSLFIKDSVVGMPPDAKNHNGIKWCIAPFDWKAKEYIPWWKARMQKLARHFDICRLHNSQGYFREWIIPKEYSSAVRGAYNPSIPLTQNVTAGFKNDPLITSEYLAEVFGPEFRRYGEFFKRDIEGNYYFKPDMSTGTAIDAYFDNRKGGEEDIRNGLKKLQEECLFVRKKTAPRIAAQYTALYKALDQNRKDLFNSLYDAHFYSSNNALWKKTGEKRLRFLRSCSNLILTADSPEPDFAYMSLQNIGILSTGSRYMGISSTTTCNTEPLGQWWRNLDEDTLQHYCNEWHCRPSKPFTAIINRTLRSGSAIAILPYQDWHTIDQTPQTDYNGEPLSDRINDPTATTGNWIWRIPQHSTL